jgi:hypothetical protein
VKRFGRIVRNKPQLRVWWLYHPDSVLRWVHIFKPYRRSRRTPRFGTLAWRRLWRAAEAELLEQWPIDWTVTEEPDDY